MAGTLVFSHANSYPAGCYRLLFEAWRAAGWQVHALDRFGHDPRFPVASNWRSLRDELLHFVTDTVRPTGPVVLVGHSLGGVLSLLAACRRPELVSRLVLLDSPVLSNWRVPLVQFAKFSGLMKRYSPAKVSLQRRQEWPDRAAVLQHFAVKTSFARWDPRVLHDYVASGFEESGGVTRLRFAREVESRIYATLPHHTTALLRRHPPRCPVDFIAGTRSRELRMTGITASRALAGERLQWIEGTHLFPFEKPDETAARVLQLLA